MREDHHNRDGGIFLEDEAEDSQTKEYLTIIIAGQRFGVPILQIQDVLRAQNITSTPLSPLEIAGTLNLRGRIVTAIDVRCRLQMNAVEIESDKQDMSVVVEYENELYSLLIDKVGDVLRLEDKHFERNPPTLDPIWKDISAGIYRLKSELLVILDVPKLISTIHN